MARLIIQSPYNLSSSEVLSTDGDIKRRDKRKGKKEKAK
jgi:hypothetical protein